VDAHIGSLRRQLADVLQVFAQLVTQFSELRLAAVFQAEGECLQHTQQNAYNTHNSSMAHQLKGTVANAELKNDLFKISHSLPKRIFYFISKFKSCAKKQPQISVRMLMIKM
jgi:hypothetical protein